LSLAFRPKSYVVPSDETELSNILKEHGGRARIIAGGTGIYEIAHRGLLSELEVLIDIRNLKLSHVIQEKGETIRLGAATTMSELAASEAIKKEKSVSAISDALTAIQPLQVKNVATIAGAICTALPFFDLPVALLSTGASVIMGPSGRSESLSEFIRGYFEINLEEGEFVREIQIPIARENTASAFQKFALTHDDWALVNCGVSVTLEEGNRKIKDSLVVFGGGIGEKPTRATSVEESLRGLNVNDDETRIKSVFEETVSKDIEPISDIRSSSEYRLHLAKVIGRRTTLQAASRI
jgi:CO/xanthine dehydrogenase FAD-binding subunit